MEEEVPQAAEGLSGEDARLPEILQMLREGIYSIGCDAEHGWWATRDGVAGHRITRSAPDELGKALADDYGDGQ
ncbi:MAG TPA: hypothetical protein VKV38_15980 [Trebonia sp.]|nr:hypothetical protein [Trebonia sp.]